MGVGDVEKRVEWEAKRVAAAINADEFRLMRLGNRTFSNIKYSSTGAFYRGLWGQIIIEWSFDVESLALESLRVGNGGPNPADVCKVYRVPIKATCAGVVWSPWATMPESMCNPQVRFKEHVSHTLYRLGFDMKDEAWLAPLNVTLSTQEKLELRLSLPSEFWPQKWLEEESEALTTKREGN